MKHFSTLACTVLLTSVLPAKQVFGKITLPLGKVEVSLSEGTWERAKPNQKVYEEISFAPRRGLGVRSLSPVVGRYESAKNQSWSLMRQM